LLDSLLQEITMNLNCSKRFSISSINTQATDVSGGGQGFENSQTKETNSHSHSTDKHHKEKEKKQSPDNLQKVARIFSKKLSQRDIFRKSEDSPKESKEKSKLLSCIPKKNKLGDYGVPKHVPTNDDIVRSGHIEFESLYATNDMKTPDFVVNTLGAPNNSTMVCGCENVSCPFCNLVLSIRNRDPSLDTGDILH